MTDSTDDMEMHSDAAQYYYEQELTREFDVAQQLTDGNGKKVISRAYADMGVSNQWEPTPFDRLRLWLTAFSGEGKTNFVMSDPESLVLDFEDSARDVPGGRAAYVHIPDSEAYMRIHSKLIEDGPAQSGFKRIVWDTVDKFLGHIIILLSAEYGCEYPKTILEYADGRVGYTKIANFIQTRLEELYAAGYGWTVVGHISEKKDASGIATAAPTLFPSAVQRIYTDTQLMLHLSREIDEVELPGAGRTIKVGGVEKKIAATKKVTRHELHILPPDGDDSDLVKARYTEALLTEFRRGRPDDGSSLNITGINAMPKLRAAWSAALAFERDRMEKVASTAPVAATSAPVKKALAKPIIRK